ncbi:metal transporter CNNM [Paragonimus westermani]|uniref:Metal transporter CNNM n=1 Tax=Paragonimus westermani TaxID=34504 RepID=A0A5J4NV06_9TREM|nr:metal transporter CNNM [Paragonimus westermani]
MKPRISIIFSWLWILHVSSASSIRPTVYGLLPESYSSISDNVVVIQSNQPVLMTMFGLELDQITHIGFATVKKPSNSPCEHERVTGSFKVVPENANIATSVITLRELSRNEDAFYLCVRTSSSINGLLTSTDIAENNSTDTSEVWFFTGTESSDERISLRTTSTLMPMWVQVILIIILFFLSGLFSGLNLGLMSLDKTELKIIESAGASSEKTYAKAIRPVREKGNLLLCTLLLGNVLVNTSLTILMDNLTGSGLYAVIGSTIGITLFGEIMPQAVCSRHGLAIGARTLWLTKLFMLITFPVAFPVSFVLDKILGEEMGQVYSREKLGVLIREQNVAGTVATDEMNIITGALALTTKTVADVMTPLSDAFMLSYSDVLDFHTMLNIYSHGYTRIPVYEGDRRNIRSVLNVKDLAFINTEDKVTVSTVCDFYNRSIIVVLDNTNLEAMLKEFRQGRTHMAFVERLVTDGEGDPYRETIGLVTLEDVIEEIIQAEIVDETDILTDNVHHQPRQVRKRDFHMFRMPDNHRYPRLSPQLKIAALRHLASNVESFHERYMCYSVLQSFLNANIVVECVYNPKDDEANILYRPNQWANYAILLLQGRAHVQIGNEGLLFEAGPFVMFGEIVLKRVNAMFSELNEKADPAMCSARLASEARFVPDYLLKAVTNLQYLRITPEHYLVARRLSAVIVRLANSGKSKLSSSQTDTSSLLIPKLHQLPGLGPVKINSHDMFQNAWDHHVVRLREASVAAAVASTIGEQHNDAVNAHSDDGFSVACQSSSPPVPSPPEDRAPNSIRIVRPYNCTTPSPNSDDSTIHKRNSLFIPHSGDVLASRPDEIQAFVSHTNELTNSDSDPTRPFRSKARAVRT